MQRVVKVEMADLQIFRGKFRDTREKKKVDLRAFIIRFRVRKDERCVMYENLHSIPLTFTMLARNFNTRNKCS